MTRRLSRWLAAGVSVFAFAVAASMANGCGGIDCTETQTCPGVADAALDQHASDGTLATGPDGSTPPEAQPAEEPSAADEASDMGDAAADATLDALEETEVKDAALDADVAPVGDAQPDSAGQGDGCPNSGGPEDCTNGIDDNCDGLIDCADPLCVPDAGFLGYRCVPTPPVGWIAPVVLYDLTVDAGTAPTVPACAANYDVRAFIGHDQPNPPASTCSCTCGGVSGASCTGPTLTFYSTQNPGCTSGVLGTSPVQTACSEVLSQGGVNGIKVTNAGTPSSNGCDAGLAATIPPFDNNNDWLRTGGGCTTEREKAGVLPKQGGCMSGQVCVENPPVTLGAHICELYEGALQACTGGYDVQFNYYDGGVDTRACGGTCTCGTPSLSCNPNVTVSNSSNCTSLIRTEMSTTCDPSLNYPGSGNQQVWAMGSSTVAPGASCAPSGSATLNGGVARNSNGVMTVCCMQ